MFALFETLLRLTRQLHLTPEFHPSVLPACLCRSVAVSISLYESSLPCPTLALPVFVQPMYTAVCTLHGNNQCIAQCLAVQHCSVPCGTVLFCAMHYIIVQCLALQYCSVPCTRVLFSVFQYSIVPCRALEYCSVSFSTVIVQHLVVQYCSVKFSFQCQ